MEYNVYFYEAFEEEAKLIKKFLPKNINAGFSYFTIQEAIKENKTPPSKIISIRTQSKIPEDWVENKKISAIISRTTGYDHLGKINKKINLGYLPDYCTRAVAEQAIMLYLALSRKLLGQIKNFENFNRNNLTGFEVNGKNMLIVGVGKIGYEISKIANALGIKVLGVDIEKKHADVDYIDIENGIKKADVIICSMNLTKDNKGYFNYESLKKAKKGVIFINISRGELSPSKDLLKLINENHIGGLALDVFDNEPNLIKFLREKINSVDEESKSVLELSKRENVILTPHNAFNTHEATLKKSKQTIEQLNNFLKTGKMKWKVPQDD